MKPAAKRANGIAFSDPIKEEEECNDETRAATLLTDAGPE
jgi:hypothetical protein